MNKKDLKILTHLRNNARMPLTKMSKETNIPVSTIFDRLKVFEEGTISKHTALIDFQKFGYTTRSTIFLKIDKADRLNAKEYLMNNQNVNSIYKINNGYDFLVDGIFKNLKNMEDFIESLENKFMISDHKSYYIIDEIKREAFMSQPELV